MLFLKNFKGKVVPKATAFLLLGIVMVFAHAELSAKSSTTVNLGQLEQECKQKNWKSCQTLAGLYFDINGEGKKAGVKKDVNKGVETLKKGCDIGGENGTVMCVALGFLYLDASSFLKQMGMENVKVKKDVNKGLEILEKSCRADAGESGVGMCMILAGLYFNAKPFLKEMGVGNIEVKKDINKGTKALEKCSNFAGEAGGMCSSLLGGLYGFSDFQKEMGITGIDMNKEKARKLFQKSCKLGNKDSCTMLEKLE